MRLDGAARDVVDRLDRVGFPGAVATLAGPGGPARATTEGPRAEVPERRPRVSPAVDMAAVLEALFAARERPSALPRDLPARAMREALERQGIAATEGEIQEVLHLLETGRFFGDLEGAANAVMDVAPEVPLRLIVDVLRTPDLVRRMAVATATDAARMPRLLADLTAHLFGRLRGDAPPPPTIQPAVLAAIYATDSLRTVRRLLSELLHHDNRTVRLALILYARANGWVVSDDDIDVVYAELVTAEQPNLAPVIERAAIVMAHHYAPVDPADLERALGFLRRGA
jgi:hypothetical protein